MTRQKNSAEPSWDSRNCSTPSSTSSRSGSRSRDDSDKHDDDEEFWVLLYGKLKDQYYE